MLNRLKSLFGKTEPEAAGEPERRFVLPKSGPPLTENKKSNSILPRFRGSRPTETLATRDPQSRLRMAFGASQPVSDARFFAGRQDTLARIIAALEGEGAHAVIYGERGIGKTSLMRVLADTARDARYLVLYDSCGADTRFDVIMRSLLSRIPLIYHRDTPPTSSAVERGGSFADLLPEDNFGARETADLLTAVTGTRLLIILDEYDRIEDAAFRRQTAELIKNLSDRMAPVHLLIAGVAEDLDGLIDYIPSIRRNIAAIPVPPMSLTEIEEILRIGSETSGLTFAEGSAERIAHYAGGSPYVARLICLYAAGLTARDQQDHVSLAHVDQGAHRVVAEWHERMPSNIKRRIEHPRSPAQRDLLAAAAVASGVNHSRFTVEAVRDAFKAAGAHVPGDLEKAIREIDLISCVDRSEPALYTLTDPGLGSYLRLQLKLREMEIEEQAKGGRSYAVR